MKKLSWQKLFSAFLFCMMIWVIFGTSEALAADYQDIRVLIASTSESTMSITIDSGEYAVYTAEENDYILDLSVGDSVSVIYNGQTYSLLVNNVLQTSEQPVMQITALNDNCLFTYGNIKYRGDFKPMHSGTYFYGVNVLDIEPYLYGVVGKEIGYSCPVEAIKAQAIAARSYALRKISSKNIYYDVTNTISSQVYGGYSAEAANIISAVDATRGLVVYYNGKIIEAVFHSNAGGYTEDVSNVWGGSELPLKGVASPFDSYAATYSSYGATTYSWTVTYTSDKLVELANSFGNTDIGEFVDISMSTSYNGVSSVSGRAMVVSISGTKNNVTAIRDTNIRRLLGVKSSLITISGSNNSDTTIGWMKNIDGKLFAITDIANLFGLRNTGAAAALNGGKSSFYAVSSSGVTEIDNNGGSCSSGTIVISGKGYGHGVGMSQWGAMGMAANGASCDEIINHYYGADGTNGITLYLLY